MIRYVGLFVIVSTFAMMMSFLFSSLGQPTSTVAATVEDGVEDGRDYDPLHTRPNEEGNSGELLYLRYCSGCHGVNGDGKGPAAQFLSPKPRDFVKGLYKFTTTPSGAPPLDDDLLRSITRGLHGTSMPSWSLLSLDARRSLVAYILTFHKEWDPVLVQPPVPIFANPHDMTDTESIKEAIDLGRTVYHKTASCWQCHVSYLERDALETLLGHGARPDLDSASASADTWGEVITPPDFSTATLKSVSGLDDLYRVIAAGVGGTAMPSWATAIKPEDLWALTLYVDSLRPQSEVKSLLKTLEAIEE